MDKIKKEPPEIAIVDKNCTTKDGKIKLVQVVWEDARMIQEDLDIVRLKKEITNLFFDPFDTISVGYLIQDTTERLVVATSINSQHDKVISVDTFLVIPRSLVREITELTEKV